jgi:hypothetical protein
MTVSSTTTSVSYTGDGSTTSFPVTFAFFGTSTDAEIRVIERVIATGVETTLVNGTDYTVSGGSGTTGTVTAAAAPAATKRWTIERTTELTQETDYVENDPFPAESHEQALDRLTMAAQEVSAAANRSVKFPVDDSTSLTATLPVAASRANKTIVFDASGNVGVSTDDYEDQLADVTAQADAAAASAAAAAASASSASTSASTATTQAGLAATAKTNAETAETNAEAAQVAAEAAQTAAEAAQTAAETAETNAETAETNAETAQAAAELAQASAEAAAAAIFWNFDTSTSMADPGTGDLRLNNATVASVTAIAVSALAAATGNPDVSDQIVTWDDSTNTNKGTITIRKAGAPATFAVFTVSGSVTDNTTWLQIAVTHVASNGALSAGDDLYLSFSRAGDKGADGTGSGDMLASAYPTLVSLEGLSLASGDILYATAADTLARLPKGTDGQALVLASGVPSWATAGGGSPAGKPFLAYIGSTQTLNNSTWTKVAFSAERFDVGGYYDHATNYRFTPAAGKWFIGAEVLFDSSMTDQDQARLIIYKNGAGFIRSDFLTGAAGEQLTVEVSGLIDANGTDYYEVYAWQNSGGSIGLSALNEYYSRFFGFQVG